MQFERGYESRLPASLLTVKYNVLFRLGIINWFPTAHNSNNLKEMALLLYAIVTDKKFNLGQFIFERISEVLHISTTVSHLGYPVLITHYLLLHNVQLEKE